MYLDNKMVHIHILFNELIKLFFVYIQNRMKYESTRVIVAICIIYL
jgi:hypothetical protein